MVGNDGNVRVCLRWDKVKNFVKNETPVLEPTELTYKVEITGETESQKHNRDIRNQ